MFGESRRKMICQYCCFDLYVQRYRSMSGQERNKVMWYMEDLGSMINEPLQKCMQHVSNSQLNE